LHASEESELIVFGALKAFASRIGVPFIGCASHRLSLAIKHIFLEESDYLFKKVSKLMVKLGSIKRQGDIIPNLALIRIKGCKLKPVRFFPVRWSGAFNMLHKYKDIAQYLTHFYNDNSVEVTDEERRNLPFDSPQLVSMTSCIPTLDEHRQLLQMLKNLKPMQKIPKNFRPKMLLSHMLGICLIF
jgi:hypothetical protein